VLAEQAQAEDHFLQLRVNRHELRAVVCAHKEKESVAMKRRELTRRQLLQNSAAFGAAALAGSVARGFIGCSSRRSVSLEAGKWRELSSPVPTGSISPRVTPQPDKNAFLSWLEPQEDRKASLRFSIWRDARWSQAATIASGLAFSRDQASAPGVIGLSPSNLIAYWSQRVSTDQQSTNEIALYMAVSSDGGAHWTTPMLVNRAAAQPGEDNAYAAAVGLDAQRAQFVWLDGRDWEKSKRVQLMSRVVSAEGHVSETRLLDRDTCTCCSTAIARTSSGLLAAYRGHNSKNIRDISLVRSVDSGWSEPHIPHPDDWHIEACPVNGPHLDARENHTALIWFTAPQDQPAVKLAFSHDGGAQFAPAVRLDTGKAVGRAQVAVLRDGSAVGIWLESEGGEARLVARRVRDDGAMGAPLELARGTNFGYPHAARTAGSIVVTWSERNPGSQVHAGLLQTD
jgi:hypothetical protein